MGAEAAGGGGVQRVYRLTEGGLGAASRAVTRSFKFSPNANSALRLPLRLTSILLDNTDFHRPKRARPDRRPASDFYQGASTNHVVAGRRRMMGMVRWHRAARRR